MLLNFYVKVSPFSGFITAILAWHLNKVITYLLTNSLENGRYIASAVSCKRYYFYRVLRKVHERI